MLTTRHKVLLARVAYYGLRAVRAAAGRGMRARVRRAGFLWDLDLAEAIDLSIYLRGTFEPHNVRTYGEVVRPGDVVVDVGANVGSHTLHLARLVGDAGRVVACEPTAWAFAKLKANLALNPGVSARVTPVQAMLVREGAATEASVYSSWPLADAGGVHELHRGRTMSTEGASALTFDALVERLALPRVDVVKLDVDGHEHHVLAGAARLLARHQPLLVLELAPYAFDGGPPGFDEMIGFLAAAGYSLTEVRSRRPLPVDGPALRALVAPGTAHNAVARPKSAKIARSNAG